jgi:hypothetical protein
MNSSESSTVLSSWKEIANYMGKGVRTVQCWKRDLGLPVRRPVGASLKSAVVLSVDAWVVARFSMRTHNKNEIKANQTLFSTRTSLKEGIRTARELCKVNCVLTEQLTATIRLLAEHCDRFNTNILREHYFQNRPPPSTAQG